MRTSPLIAVSLAVLTACATEVKAPSASAVASLSVATGALALLDGSASSDPAGRALAYDWSFTARPAGSQAALNDPHLARPSFTPDVTGVYTLQLVVSNGVHPSAPVTVTVTAAACGAARPVAQLQVLAPAMAGPGAQVTVTRVPVASTVLVSGAASSDPDNGVGCAAGQALAYHWTLDAVPAGATATLNSASAVDPSFTVGVPGTYRLSLVVTDSTGLASAAATLSVTADPSFGAVLPGSGFTIATVNAGAAQAMSLPRGVAVDASGAIFVAQAGSARVTRHQAGGVSILAEGAYLTTALQDLALDTTQASPRLLATAGARVVAVDPVTGLQSLFADFSFNGGGQSFRGLAVGVTAMAAATATSRIAVADRGNSQVLLFDPATASLPVTTTAATTTVAFGAGLQAPWGVAMLPPAPGVTAASIFFAGSNGSGSILRNAAGATTTLLAGTGALVLDGARDLALSPCPTPRLLVAVGSGILAVDPATGAFQTLVTGLGAPAGLAFDVSGAQPSLLVTDDATAKQALYRIDGPFCSL
jgi:hypothetical protein